MNSRSFMALDCGLGSLTIGSIAGSVGVEGGMKEVTLMLRNVEDFWRGL